MNEEEIKELKYWVNIFDDKDKTSYICINNEDKEKIASSLKKLINKVKVLQTENQVLKEILYGNEDNV